MRRTVQSQTIALITLAVIAGACVHSYPQVQSSAGDVTTTPVNASTLPAGTTMTVQLEQTLGTKSSKVGDQFTATTSRSVVAQNGQTVVPSGAIVYGHVTGLHSPNIIGENAYIRLDFDSLTFQGNHYPFDASISSVAAAGKSTGSTSSTVRSATVGAAAGAVLGAIISGGELEKIIGGGLLGAAAGTVISLGRGDVESVLPAGSTLTVQSTETIAIR